MPHSSTRCCICMHLGPNGQTDVVVAHASMGQRDAASVLGGRQRGAADAAAAPIAQEGKGLRSAASVLGGSTSRTGTSSQKQPGEEKMKPPPLPHASMGQRDAASVLGGRQRGAAAAMEAAPIAQEGKGLRSAASVLGGSTSRTGTSSQKQPGEEKMKPPPLPHASMGQRDATSVLGGRQRGAAAAVAAAPIAQEGKGLRSAASVLGGSTSRTGTSSQKQPGEEKMKPPPLPSLSVQQDDVVYKRKSPSLPDIEKKPPPPLLELAAKYRAELGLGPQRSPPPLPTKEELAAYHNPLASSNTAAHDAYEAIDKDRDGTLTYEEVRSEVIRRCPGATEQYLQEIWATFDADASGERELPLSLFSPATSSFLHFCSGLAYHSQLLCFFVTTTRAWVLLSRRSGVRGTLHDGAHQTECPA
eukprot:COSAG02_NODE_3856_length_6138_cov_12.727604_3_plen_416_part_00